MVTGVLLRNLFVFVRSTSGWLTEKDPPVFLMSNSDTQSNPVDLYKTCHHTFNCTPSDDINYPVTLIEVEVNYF